MKVSMSVFINISKIKLVLLQDTVYSPENSSLTSAEFFGAPEIRKKKKKEKQKGGWDISGTT